MAVSEQLHLDRFAASARQALLDAQQQAAQMQAQKVYLEHLLLAILAQDDDETAEVLNRLGMNMQVLRAQVPAIFGRSTPASSNAQPALPLTHEAHACLDWAIAFAEQRDISPVPSAYVLLGVIRHQKAQPLLALLLSSARILLSSLTQGQGWLTPMRSTSSSRRKSVNRATGTSPMTWERPLASRLSVQRSRLQTFLEQRQPSKSYTM